MKILLFFSYHIFPKGCQSKFRFWWNMYLRSLLNMYHTKPTYVCKYVHKCTYVYYYRFNKLLKLNLLWTKKMATATIVWQFTLKTFQIISSSQVKSIQNYIPKSQEMFELFYIFKTGIVAYFPNGLHFAKLTCQTFVCFLHSSLSFKSEVISAFHRGYWAELIP